MNNYFKKSIWMIAVTFLICTGCSQNISDKIVGTWAIHRAFVNDEEALWDLSTNAVTFNENHSVLLPTNMEQLDEERFSKGKWQLDKEDGAFYLTIDTDNNLFNRKFKIEKLATELQENKNAYLYKLILTSDSLRFECAQGFYK